MRRTARRGSTSSSASTPRAYSSRRPMVEAKLTSPAEPPPRASSTFRDAMPARVDSLRTVVAAAAAAWASAGDASRLSDTASEAGACSATNSVDARARCVLRRCDTSTTFCTIASNSSPFCDCASAPTLSKNSKKLPKPWLWGVGEMSVQHCAHTSTHSPTHQVHSCG